MAPPLDRRSLSGSMLIGLILIPREWFDRALSSCTIVARGSATLAHAIENYTLYDAIAAQATERLSER
jgi:hypothetical protein